MSPPGQRNGPPPPGPPASEGPAGHSDDSDDSSPGREELRFAAFRLIYPALHAAREQYGLVPAPGSLGWWRAPDTVRTAGLLALAGDSLIASPDEIAAEMIKAASVAISEGLKAHRDLIRRRKAAIDHALRCDGTCARRCGGPAAAIALTEHHASDQWWTTHPAEEAA